MSQLCALLVCWLGEVCVVPIPFPDPTRVLTSSSILSWVVELVGARFVDSYTCDNKY